MLKRFAVKNYKNFNGRTEISFDNVRNYEFNKKYVKDGLLNKIIVLGKNGSGKTNLGFAIFDIVVTLTSNQYNPYQTDDASFLNGDSTEKYATFEYEFKQGDRTIRYEYRKAHPFEIVYERLEVDGELYFSRDGDESDYTRLKNECANDLQIDIKNGPMSVLRFVSSNTVQDEHSPVSFIMNFVNKMLYFKSDIEGNSFIGLDRYGETLTDFIINNGLEDDFKRQLNELGGIDVDIECVKIQGMPGTIVQRFKNSRLNFQNIASSGTKTFMLFYYCSKRFDDVEFLYMDDFDAQYHYEMALNVLRFVAGRMDFQAVFTTNNTALLSNDILRPDCYMTIGKDGIRSFSDSTEREIRKGHNIEKLYRNGEFDE